MHALYPGILDWYSVFSSIVWCIISAMHVYQDALDMASLIDSYHGGKCVTIAFISLSHRV